MLGIEYIRSQLGMNISELAKKISVSRQIVSKWEKGEKKIPDKRLKELAEICGIPEKYFSKELDFADKINITSLINREKKDMLFDGADSEISELLLEAIKADDTNKLQQIYNESNEEYIEFIHCCKEKITIAQRKLVMDISACENKAKNNSIDDLEKMYYYSQLYSDMAEMIIKQHSQIKIIANVLNELTRRN